MDIFKNINKLVFITARFLLSLSLLIFFLLHPYTFCPLNIVFFSLLFFSRVSSTFFALKPQKSHCRCYIITLSLSLACSVLIPFSNSNHNLHVLDKHLFGVFILFYIFLRCLNRCYFISLSLSIWIQGSLSLTQSLLMNLLLTRSYTFHLTLSRASTSDTYNLTFDSCYFFTKIF